MTDPDKLARLETVCIDYTPVIPAGSTDWVREAFINPVDESAPQYKTVWHHAVASGGACLPVDTSLIGVDWGIDLGTSIWTLSEAMHDYQRALFQPIKDMLLMSFHELTAAYVKAIAAEVVVQASNAPVGRPCPRCAHRGGAHKPWCRG